MAIWLVVKLMFIIIEVMWHFCKSYNWILDIGTYFYEYEIITYAHLQKKKKKYLRVPIKEIITKQLIRYQKFKYK